MVVDGLFISDLYDWLCLIMLEVMRDRERGQVEVSCRHCAG